MSGPRAFALIVVLGVVLTGCSDELLDEIGLSEEDRTELEDLVQDLAEAAEEAQEGAAGDGAPGDDSDEPGLPQEPDWSPDGIPPPPGEPSASEDQSDESFCPPGHSCGWASYDGDDGTAATEHYKDVFGRPPDQETRRPSVGNDGQPYDAVTSVWDDGDASVTVYNDHNGTDVTVQTESNP